MKDIKYNFNDKNIFIIEDNPSTRKLYQDYLSETNCNLTFFDLRKKSKIIKIISEVNPHIILMDVVSINKPNRYSLIKKIKKIYKNMTILVISGLKTEKQIFKSINAGACYHMTKPFTKELLLSGIQLYLTKL